MLLSKVYLELESIKQLEQDAIQLFNNSINKDIIEASIYFIKGAELMQKALSSIAIQEEKGVLIRDDIKA